MNYSQYNIPLCSSSVSCSSSLPECSSIIPSQEELPNSYPFHFKAEPIKGEIKEQEFGRHPARHMRKKRVKRRLEIALRKEESEKEEEKREDLKKMESDANWFVMQFFYYTLPMSIWRTVR